MRVANVEAFELVFLVEKDGVVGLGVDKVRVTSLATVRP